VVWGWLSWVVWLSFWVLSNTFVFDISNISSIGIGNVVGDDLGTAIGKVDTVFTVGGISITGFVGLEVSVSIVVMDSISVLVYSWSFFVDWSLSISWGMVSWGMVSWSMYYWFVDNWGLVWSWSWGMISWSMYYWFVDYWGWVVYWGWGMVCWGMYYWLVYNWGMINWSSVVNWGSVVWTSLVDWNMGRSMDSSTVFFSSIWVMYVLWGSMGLA